MRSIILSAILFWLPVANLSVFAQTPETPPGDFAQRRNTVLDLNNQAMGILNSNGDKHRAQELINKAIGEIDIYPRGGTEPIQLLLNGMIIANAASEEVALARYRVQAIQLATHFDPFWLDTRVSLKAFQLEQNGDWLEAAEASIELLDRSGKFVEDLKLIHP